MNALRLHVERVVRPLAASSRRKDRMRHELLAHLTAAFDEEVSKDGSQDRAIERTLQRFGEPAALRKELQATVPILERVFLNDVLPIRRMTRRLGKPPLRHALRMSMFVFLATFGFAVVGVGTALAISGNARKGDHAMKMLLPFYAMLFVLHLVGPFLADRMRKAICAGFAPSRSPLIATVWGSIAGVLAFASGLIGWCIITLDARGPFFRGVSDAMPVLVPVALATPFLLALYAYLSARDIRRFDEDPWRVLEIEQ